MKLGLTSRNIFIKSDILSDKAAVSAIYVLGFMTALILWAFGLVWLFFASASILRCKKFPFNIGWWGFTFPLGAYALATCQLGWEMPSRFFKVLGTVRCNQQTQQTQPNWIAWLILDTRYFRCVLSSSGLLCPWAR